MDVGNKEPPNWLIQWVKILDCLSIALTQNGLKGWPVRKHWVKYPPVSFLQLEDDMPECFEFIFSTVPCELSLAFLYHKTLITKPQVILR